MSLKVKRLIKIISLVLLVLTICFVVLAYLKYQDFKKALILKMSDEATSFIGQKVEINDISFSAAGINVYDISVKNPEGFISGKLLKIKKLHLNMRYKEFLSRKLHFKKIIVYSPELTLIRDQKGRFNISEKLRNFFKRKPTINYQIDNLELKLGSIDYDKLFKIEKIDVRIKNLSSNAGVKTSIKGSSSFAEDNKISFEGWAYLKDEPKRLNISVLSKDINLSLFKQIFNKYGINTENTKNSFYLNAWGDTTKGLNIKSDISIKKAGFAFFKRDTKEILLHIRAFLNIPENLLSIEDCSICSDQIAAATLKGEIKKREKDFVFAIWPKINKLDLSTFNFVKDALLNGIITSENLFIHGSIKKHFPEISGTVNLRDGVFKSKDVDIGGINAELIFLPGKNISARAETTVRISRLKGYQFNTTANANFIFKAKEDLRDIVFRSYINLLPVEIDIEKENKVQMESLALDVKGNFKEKKFSVEGLADIRNVQYKKYNIPQLHTEFIIENRGENIALKNLNIDGKDFKLTSELVTVNFLEKGKKVEATIRAEKLNAYYPVKKAEIRDTSLHLDIRRISNLIEGTSNFSIGSLWFNGIHTGSIRGGGKFNNEIFSLEIPKAEVFHGNVRLKADGRISKSLYPLKIELCTEDIDLGKMSEETMKIIDLPYRVSGNLKRFIFDGILENAGVLEGRAKIEAEKIEVLDKKTKSILKDISMIGDGEFKGEDISFIIEASEGRISADISGSVKKFFKKDRLFEIKITHPEIKLTDVRETLWEVFPDSFLYAELGGSFSSVFSIKYTASSLQVNGKLKLNNIVLEGENREYYVGPINGVIPIGYKKPRVKAVKDTPLFERSEFNNLKKYFSRGIDDSTYSKITIGSLMYGFKLLDNITLWVKQESNIFNVERFSADVFGGKMYGTAVFDISNGYNYKVGSILKGLRLSTLCEEITPIRGYLSGMVDGFIHLKGTNGGISTILGKTNFWTYSAKGESTKLSREFLKKVGGQSIKTYLGDRNFNKGFMDLYVQNGFLIFHELEISNKNFFGFTDLLIKVAPFNNRIAIDDLMWTITEAANRVRKEKD